ncbi:molecular chaperone DnaJ [Actinoplanes sp. NPDC020271]|uniref:molecular chaperone DnaJ n=1 Tax=Actinoplanes sp. NPDC020271 TaxID=3363896 RepID=UPI0037BB1C60
MNPGYAKRFDEIAARIAAASTFAELVDETGVGIDRQAYRILAKIVHPDVADATRRGPANEAFAKLNALYNASARYEPRDRKDRREPDLKGDLADLFSDGVTLVKVVRDPANNDLMAAEAAALRRLRDHGDPAYRAYAPRLADSFSYYGRTANVVARQRGFRNLAEMPDFKPADLVWIWRRLLAGLGWAHRAGVVHAAVFEEHVLIDPRVRGLVLVDWCYSTAIGRRPKALIARREPLYPPEIPTGRPLTTATDIHLASSLMKRLFGPDMPDPLRRFADGCRYDAPRMRPQNAWQLLTEFDELIPRQYRK